MKGVTSSVIRPKQHEERGKPPPENITEYGFGKTTSLSLGTRPSPQSINLLKVLCLFAFSHLKHVFHSLKTQSLNSSNLPFLSFFCSFTPSPPIHLILLLTLSPFWMMCLIDMNVELCSTHISLFITIMLSSTHTQTHSSFFNLSHPTLNSLTNPISNQHNTHSPSTISSIITLKSFILPSMSCIVSLCVC